MGCSHVSTRLKRSSSPPSPDSLPLPSFPSLEPHHFEPSLSPNAWLALPSLPFLPLLALPIFLNKKSSSSEPTRMTTGRRSGSRDQARSSKTHLKIAQSRQETRRGGRDCKSVWEPDLDEPRVDGLDSRRKRGRLVRCLLGGSFCDDYDDATAFVGGRRGKEGD